MKNTNYNELVQYITENQDKFYRLAFSYTQNKEYSLDIVQNAICKALQNYSSIRNFAFLKTWFYRILVNESLSFLRKTKMEVLSDFSNMPEPVYHETAYECTDDLYKRINLLPPEMQTIIKLHYYEEMTLKEIAAITDTNLNTVKTRLYAGLKRLRIQIEEVAL